MLYKGIVRPRLHPSARLAVNLLEQTPIPHMNTPFRFLFAIAFIMASLAARADEVSVERGAKLILSSSNMEPTTTFELRFDEAIIKPEQVGAPASDCPLVFSPSLSGRSRG